VCYVVLEFKVVISSRQQERGEGTCFIRKDAVPGWVIVSVQEREGCALLIIWNKNIDVWHEGRKNQEKEANVGRGEYIRLVNVYCSAALLHKLRICMQFGICYQHENMLGEINLDSYRFSVTSALY
jgi:hypothetical protein